MFLKKSNYLKDDKELMKEYDFKKNSELEINKLRLKSNKKVWWKCNKGHEWQTAVINRANGTGCPYCKGQRAIVGENDLLTINPSFMKEWDYSKNEVLPETLMVNSHKKVWWICNKGHSFCNSPHIRNRGVNCPKCSVEKVTSLQEKIVFFYIKKYFKNAKPNYKPNGFGKRDLDIFIPELNIGIEYDGGYYHTNAKSDIDKDKLCENNGIKLYRIRDTRCCKLNSTSICFYRKDKTNADLEHILTEILKDLHIKNPIINILNDLENIYSVIDYYEKENSIKKTNPELLDEWNYERNGNLKPDHISIGSSKKVWWKCDKGHEWIATPKQREKGNKCIYCYPRYQKDKDDVKRKLMNLKNEWDYNKNIITIEETLGKITQKVWWLCPNNHSYEMSLLERYNDFGCPYCSGHRVLKGFNDIASTNPELLNEWNYKKNKKSPYELSSGSNYRAWWICSKGHEWEAPIYARVSGSGCPTCNSNSIKINQYTESGKFIQQFNSLTDAGKSVGISVSGIKYACDSNSLTNGFQWRIDQGDTSDIGRYENTNKCIKKVMQYDLHGNYIKTFDGVRKAMEETGAKKVSEVCSGKRKSSGGYIWKYAESDNIK